MPWIRVYRAMQESREDLCWQCGAPADPNCATTQNLVARASRNKDSLGYPVKRGIRGSDVVKVAVPRCVTCQARNYLWQFLLMIGFLFGAIVGGLTIPSKGWTTIMGAVIGCLPGALVIFYHRTRYHLRSLDDYPALKQLRQNGWTYPN